MSTYKIGNKVKVIIRSYAPCKIGDIELEYGNQPYTFLDNIEASIVFKDHNVTAKSQEQMFLAFDHDELSELRLNNAVLNDRILQLVYKNHDEKLFSKQEYYTSSVDKKIYLNINDEIYQVFVYDDEGNLEQAYGTYNDTIIEVEKAEVAYSIYYSYIGSKAFNLTKPENFYVTIDLNVIGNENDGTQDMNIHLEKCLLRANKSIYFNNSNTNAIDLIATIITTDNNYITLK